MTNKELGVGSRIKHIDYEKGVVVDIKNNKYEVVFFEYGKKEISKDPQYFEIIEAFEIDQNYTTIEKIERTLKNIIETYSDIQEVVEIADKWKNGKLILQPENTELKNYEIPISSFFHKITMVRDRLRVMEQRINSSNLEEEEKINLQQYISRIYGSLTSFNILFKNKDENFTGIRKQS